ncbi:hypothetical protein KXV85_011128, partial [Aspergillus fumigatus]
MALRLIRTLPGERPLLSPLPCQHGPAGIDARVAAPGPHDFAVRCRVFVRTICIALTQQASIATRATLRDDRASSLVAARAGIEDTSDLRKCQWLISVNRHYGGPPLVLSSAWVKQPGANLRFRPIRRRPELHHRHVPLDAGAEHFVHRPAPPVVGKDLDLGIAGKTLRLDGGADALDVDDAVAHHAAVVEH